MAGVSKISKKDADRLLLCGNDQSEIPDKSTKDSSGCTLKKNRKKAKDRRVSAAFYTIDGRTPIKGLTEPGSILIKLGKKDVTCTFIDIANSSEFSFSLEDGVEIQSDELISTHGVSEVKVFAKFKPEHYGID